MTFMSVLPEEVLLEHTEGTDNTSFTAGPQLQELHFTGDHPVCGEKGLDNTEY